MDEILAHRLSREWLGDGAEPTPLRAMNSSTWLVELNGARHVIKVSNPTDAPGLQVARWLETRGFPTGAPVRFAVVEGRLVALLRFVDGRPLDIADAPRVGEALGRAHRLLTDAPVPPAMDRWPWPWLDPGVIEETALRDAATTAVERAESLAPGLTQGVLHGDPAPEAFLEGAGDLALIDWGAAVHGPLLYDVASAWMYTARSDALLRAYARHGPLAAQELDRVPDFLALRWAVQAWYFSVRLAEDDLTGIESQAENEKGLADARDFLLGEEGSVSS